MKTFCERFRLKIIFLLLVGSFYAGSVIFKSTGMTHYFLTVVELIQVVRLRLRELCVGRKMWLYLCLIPLVPEAVAGILLSMTDSMSEIGLKIFGELLLKYGIILASSILIFDLNLSFYDRSFLSFL